MIWARAFSIEILPQSQAKINRKFNKQQHGQLDQIWSNLIKNQPNLIKFDQNWSNLIKFAFSKLPRNQYRNQYQNQYDFQYFWQIKNIDIFSVYWLGSISDAQGRLGKTIKAVVHCGHTGLQSKGVPSSNINRQKMHLCFCLSPINLQHSMQNKSAPVPCQHAQWQTWVLRSLWTSFFSQATLIYKSANSWVQLLWFVMHAIRGRPSLWCCLFTEQWSTTRPLHLLCGRFAARFRALPFWSGSWDLLSLFWGHLLLKPTRWAALVPTWFWPHPPNSATGQWDLSV